MRTADPFWLSMLAALLDATGLVARVTARLRQIVAVFLAGTAVRVLTASFCGS